MNRFQICRISMKLIQLVNIWRSSKFNRFLHNNCLEKSYFKLMKDKRTRFHHRCSRLLSVLLMFMSLVQVNPNFICIESNKTTKI